jgi:hypothetical protein
MNPEVRLCFIPIANARFGHSIFECDYDVPSGAAAHYCSNFISRKLPAGLDPDRRLVPPDIIFSQPNASAPSRADEPFRDGHHSAIRKIEP